MKKEYTNPQCEYWCYVSGQLCSVGDALYGKARMGTPTPNPQMNPGSPRMSDDL